jgi:hypothetical protein
MDMNWQDAALVMAGMIGGAVAVFHGILVQRHMVRPIEAALGAGKRAPAPIRRLVPGLLHFSTFNWLLGGLALIAAPIGFARSARPAICLLVGSSYVYGALGNFWATRGRHPGWMLYAVALLLILYGGI